MASSSAYGMLSSKKMKDEESLIAEGGHEDDAEAPSWYFIGLLSCASLAFIIAILYFLAMEHYQNIDQPDMIRTSYIIANSSMSCGFFIAGMAMFRCRDADRGFRLAIKNRWLTLHAYMTLTGILILAVYAFRTIEYGVHGDTTHIQD